VADRITAEQFTEADGVADWSATGESAEATFRTGSFAAGVALIERIGVLADGANHHPDVDLRYATVTVRLTTHDAGGLTTKDLALARDVSDAARGLGIAAEAH
jgi:4a-hydroxytetrahydrobiopterin dehydratase